jgi:hypothetical protein
MSNNTSFGSGALAAKIIGNNNTAIGVNALTNYLGNNEVAVGLNALANDTNFNPNNASKTFLQYNPFANDQSNGNTAIGYNALTNTKTDNNGEDATGNTAVGYNALAANTIGFSNVAIGAGALMSNQDGIGNVAIGGPHANDNLSPTYTLGQNTTGNGNVAIGWSALSICDSGTNNVAIGANSLSNNIKTGIGNVAIGAGTGVNAGDVSHTIIIGYDAGTNSFVADGDIIIGYNLVPLSSSKSPRCFIANIYNTIISSTTIPVQVSDNNQLGVLTSSRQFKENIQPILNNTELTQRLLALEPVAFNYRDDPRKQKQYGLIAEDVFKIMPELVALKQDEEKIEEMDEKGIKHIKSVPKGEPKPYTVCYHLLTPLLLKEVIRLNRENEQIIQKNEQLVQEVNRLGHENEQIIQENKKLLNLINNIIPKLEKIGITV